MIPFQSNMDKMIDCAREVCPYITSADVSKAYLKRVRAYVQRTFSATCKPCYGKTNECLIERGKRASGFYCSFKLCKV